MENEQETYGNVYDHALAAFRNTHGKALEQYIMEAAEIDRAFSGWLKWRQSFKSRVPLDSGRGRMGCE